MVYSLLWERGIMVIMFLTMGKGNYGMFHTMGAAGFISSTVLSIRGKPQVQRLVQQWPWPSADALLPGLMQTAQGLEASEVQGFGFGGLGVWGFGGLGV